MSVGVLVSISYYLAFDDIEMGSLRDKNYTFFVHGFGGGKLHHKDLFGRIYSDFGFICFAQIELL